MAIGLATGGLGDVAALAPSGDYLGAAGLAIGGSGIFAAGESSALDSGVTDGVTNEEATWDWLGPPQAMTPRDQGDLSAYIGKMSQQYVSERDGSLTGERLATLESVGDVRLTMLIWLTIQSAKTKWAAWTRSMCPSSSTALIGSSMAMVQDQVPLTSS